MDENLEGSLESHNEMMSQSNAVAQANTIINNANSFSFGKIFSEAIRTFKENFVKILIISLIFYVPMNLISALTATLTDEGFYVANFQITANLYWLFGSLPILMFIFMVKSKKEENRLLKISELFSLSGKRWGYAIGISFLLGLFVLGLLLLLIVPGIIFAVYWSFATVIIVYYPELKGKKVLDYSKSVVKGRWAKVFGYSFLMSAILFVISYAVDVALGLFITDKIYVFVSGLIFDLIFVNYYFFHTSFFTYLDNTKIN